MRTPHRPSTPSDIRFRTTIARNLAGEAVAAAEAYQSDRDAEKRKAKGECRACYYLWRERIGGSAMTYWNCGVCGREQLHGSTATPRVCGECAEEHTLCTHCGGDQRMRNGRRKFPTLKAPEVHCDD